MILSQNLSIMILNLRIPTYLSIQILSQKLRNMIPKQKKNNLPNTQNILNLSKKKKMIKMNILILCQNLNLPTELSILILNKNLAFQKN